MLLSGLKILYLVAPEFEDLEFWVPVMRLREEGAEVTIAGPKARETYQGKGGLLAVSDVSFDEVDPSAYAGVVVPGGWAPDKLRRYESVKRLVRNLYAQGKTVGLICHAGLVGIVQGHRATGSEGIKDDLLNAGAQWVDEPALRSKNIVWGRVVPDIPFFCRELVSALAEQKTKG